MTPEQILEEIMLLTKRERQQLFSLINERPLLRRDSCGQEAESTAKENDSVIEQPPLPLDGKADFLIIWDGGSKGNPGKGYGSYKLTAIRTGKSRVERLTFPGNRTTNNEAEYETLIQALKTLGAKLRERGKDPKNYSLDLRGDSQLVIYQILGKWKAKNKRMATYRDTARTLLKQFGSYTIRHHDRKHSVAALGH
jgi:ribonuclease HI